MDGSVEGNVSDVTSSTSIIAVASSILGVIKGFIGVFVLSDDERSQAEIDLDNFHQRHDGNKSD